MKPEEFGDSYWCYKQYPAILVLACVDVSGLFTFVDAGAPGSVGDTVVYNNSQFKERIASGQWLSHQVWNCNGMQVRPYIVGDSAFALSQHLMKIFLGDDLSPTQQ